MRRKNIRINIKIDVPRAIRGLLLPDAAREYIAAEIVKTVEQELLSEVRLLSYLQGHHSNQRREAIDLRRQAAADRKPTVSRSQH